MNKVVKLTPRMLRNLIETEVKKGFGDMEDVEKKEKDTEEVDADEYADALDKHIDYLKALKVEEKRLVSRLKRVKESRIRVAKMLAERA
jgi:uncharacterized protein YdaT